MDREIDIRRIEVIDDATVAIARRIGPGGRLRLSCFMGEVARRLAVEWVDERFDGLSPLDRFWKIQERLASDRAPNVRLESVGKLASKVGLGPKWCDLKETLGL